MGKFQSTRKDGKSDATVLLELFRAGTAGRVYTFDELAHELGRDSSRTFSHSDVRAISMRIYRRLLREQNRALHNVRGIGYRLAEAREHNRLALVRKSRADRQFDNAIATLRGVRWDELDPESRKVHEGTLMLYSALESQQRAMETRLRRVEDAVGELLNKA